MHRRKTLWNNLTSHFGKSEEVKNKLDQALENAAIKPSIRGEALSISDFACLLRCFERSWSIIQNPTEYQLGFLLCGERELNPHA